jgi:hypothetical protein
MISDTSITDSSSILARGSILYCSNKNLYRILSCTKINNFESIFNQGYGSGLLSSALARTHEIVYEPLNYVDLRFVKLSMLMSPHAMGDIYWFKRDVLFQPRILYVNPFETPLSEQLNLLNFTQTSHLDKGFGFRNLYLRVV